MKERTKKVWGVLVGTVVLVIATTVLLLKTSWGEERVRRLVEHASKSPNGHLEVKRIGDFEFFSPPGVIRFTVEEMQYLDAEDTKAFGVSELTADLALSGLITREIVIEHASISGAQIPWDIQKSRPQANLPPASRSAFEPRSIGLELEDVEIAGLYLVTTTREGKRAILGRFTGELALAVPRDLPGVRGRIDRFRGTMSHPEAIRLDKASGDIDTSASTVADIRFTAEVSGTELSGRLNYVPRNTDDPLQVNIEGIRQLRPGTMANPLKALGGGFPAKMFESVVPQNAHKFPKGPR